MGLGNLRKKLDLFWQVNKAVSKFQEVQRMGKLKPVFTWFSGAFATYVGVKVLESCPDLVVQIPSILGIAFTAAIAFLMKVPKDAKQAGWKTLVIGGLSAGWVAAVAAFGETCPALISNWSGFFMSLALGGMHLFIQGPRDPAALQTAVVQAKLDVAEAKLDAIALPPPEEPKG